ncbi:MAG: hypothetical protein ABIW84_02860, partial [Ilumatobacteraceae bacterium]
MRMSLITVAAVGLLLAAGCSSDGNSTEGGGVPAITGPAAVDMTTIAPITLPVDSDTTAAGTEDTSQSTRATTAATPATTVDATTDATAVTTDDATGASSPANSVAPPPPTFAPYVSEIYSDADHWICRGDTDDVCDDSYPLTEVAADGALTEVPYSVAVDPPVDCFYVYPTVSGDPSFNSDLIADREISTTQYQAARFNQVCRMFVP